MADFRKTFTVLDSGSGYLDLTANHATPQEIPGAERRIMTAYGPASVRYGCSGAGCSRGELQAYVDAVQVTNFTSGSTTTGVKTGAAWTANAYQYDTLIITDDVGGAGADPEGFCSPIIKNTTETLYLDPNNPLPAAIAANDDGYIVTFCRSNDSAAGDEVNDLFGIASVAITATYWGWFFFDGLCPYALVKAGTALTVDKALIADVARVSISSTSSDELLIGTTIGKVGFSNDLASDVVCVKLDNLGHARSVSA